MEDSTRRATTLLQDALRGDGHAETDLFPLVYERLRSVAAGLMARERSDHTLQPTALVHEAWIDLIDQNCLEGAESGEARRRFIGLAAHAMRRVLVDHARRGGRLKRGAAVQRITLDGNGPLEEIDSHTLLDLEAALVALAARSERLARLTELRLFGGLSTREIAPLLGISVTTAKDDWALARSMLSRSLGYRAR